MSCQNHQLNNIMEIKFDKRNYRKHGEKNKRLIRKSLQENGAGRSILLDSDNSLIAGNGVYEQAKKLGIPVKVIETDGTELIAVKRTDIGKDDDRRTNLAIADNATSDLSEWNTEALMQDFQAGSLAEWGIELPDAAAPIDEHDIQEDEYKEEENMPSIAKPGDIWQLGDHRLMCGDSTNADDVRRLMGGGKKVHLLLTDPPYNVDIKNSHGMTIQNDNMSSQEFGIFLTKAFQAAQSVMQDGAAFYVWFSSKEHVNFETSLNKAGLYVRQELIWNKNHFILGRQDYQNKYEPCLYGWNDGAGHYFRPIRTEATVIPDSKELNIDKMNRDDMRTLLHQIFDSDIPTDVIDENKPMINDEHPTMKPVKLFGRLIINSSLPGQSVLDIFGGSGTTMIACEQLGRKCYMMELDPHYCDVIIARWEKFTGRKAVRMHQQP